MQMIRVIIADDTALLRRLLADRLNREPGITLVGEANDGREAVDLAARVKPDVAILDLDMPHLNGIQATQRILAQNTGIKIILLTAHEQLASLGRLSGASVCLDKTCSIAEIADAIRRAAAEGETVTAQSESVADANAPQLTIGIERLSLQVSLSARERDVVEKMACTEMTASQIAHALTKEAGSPVTESAVKHAMERALTKLGVEPRTRGGLIRKVFEAASANGGGAA
jgi:DNA-binding NarL/FixJ family response regulator